MPRAASDGVSVVHAAGLRLKDHRTMAIWLRIAPAAGFAKLDRSTIVRLSAIKAVIPHGRGASIQFKSDAIPVGRTGCTELRRIMSASPEVSCFSRPPDPSAPIAASFGSMLRIQQ